MRTKAIKILLTISLVVCLPFLESCSNAHWSSSMGVNMQFGPGGPRVSPSFNVGVYSGGRY